MMRIRIATLLLAALALGALASFSKFRHDPGKSIGHVVARETGIPSDRRGLDERFMSTDVPKSIQDFDTVISVLNVPLDTVISDLDVLVTLTHTWVRDLRISLVSPGGIEILLLTLFPGDSAENMTECWFDDEAGQSIYEGQPPFTGAFRPLEPLDSLDGQSSLGTWTLKIVDQFRLDSGRLEAWGVEINPAVNLRGTVRDAQTRRPIGGIQVLIMETGQRTTTASAGTYSFSGIAPGAYTARFSRVDSVNFSSVSDPVVIPDGGVAEMPIDVGIYEPQEISNVEIAADSITTLNVNLTPRDATLADVNVTVNIIHTYVGDLRLYLVAPEGQEVQLIDSTRARGGANLVSCRFDDEAARAFTAGSAPFTGSWRPLQSLDTLDGRRARGSWRLRAEDLLTVDSGSVQSVIVHITTGAAASRPRPPGLPRTFVFYGNYPNPFNATTTFRLALAQRASVELNIYNVMGQQVAKVVGGVLETGTHAIRFDASGLPSGLYFARLTSAGISQTTKMVLLR